MNGEWTEETVLKFYGDEFPTSAPIAIDIADAHNASIAAERENTRIAQKGARKQLEETLQLRSQLAVLTRENDGRDEKEAEYAGKMVAEIQARDKQLAAAQAAMKQGYDYLDSLCNPRKSPGGLTATSVRDKLKSDTAALDAAIAAESKRADDSIVENVRLMNELATAREAQQPLIDVLKAIRSQLLGRNKLDPLLPIIEAALAKVKE